MPGHTQLRGDSERRTKIVSAVIDLIERDGVSTISHRRAATAAGVALGATTYYFDSLGDLLAAALEEIARGDLLVLEQRMESVSTYRDVATALAEHVCDARTTNSKTAVLATEFMALALRHDEVRQVALAWITEWREILTQYVSDQAARGAMAALGGLIQQAQLAQQKPSKTDITQIMLRILDEGR